MKEIDVRIDKRTELMSVLLYVSNYRKEYPNLILFNKDIKYVKDVFDHFSKFQNHKAVKLLNEIVETLNFSYDAPYQLAWELKENFSVGKLKEYPFKNRLNSSPIVKEFMKEIKSFAEDSDFEKFYNEHENYYQHCIDKVKSKIDFDELSHFEEFYKENTDREYIVNLLPLCSRCGAFYDMRDDKKYVMHLTNDEFGNFEKNVGENCEGWLFRVFTLCKLRLIVDKNRIEVPETKEFAKILKTQYTPGTNLQYICEEIAAVMRTVFKEKFCQKYFETDSNFVKNELEMLKTKGHCPSYEIYDILTEWQKSNEPLEKYIQRLFNLF